MAERRVTLTKYDPSSDCANTWASELFTVAKLGRLVRRIQNNVKGYGEFSLRTLDERREESKTPEQWAQLNANARSELDPAAAANEERG